MKKRLMIVVFIVISIFSLVVMVNNNHHEKKHTVENKEKVVNKKDIKDENNNDGEEIEEGEAQIEANDLSNNEDVIQDKKSQSSQANTSVSQNDTSLSTKSSTSDTTSNTKAENNNSNDINKTDLYYSIHKGRKSCNEYSECQNSAIDLFLKYKKVIEEYAIYDVTTNDGNILYYFVAYRFKEGIYEDEGSCNSIGNEIKNKISGVTNYKCSNRDNKFYLNISTDY